MTTRGLSAPALAPEADISKWGEAAHRELRSLETERDPELRQQGLLTLGRRLVRQDRMEPALRVFHFLQENISGASPLANRTAREIDAIEGRGATGDRAEFLLRRFAGEVTHPAMLAGMAAGSAVYQLSRAAFLGRLLSAPAGLVTRGFGAQALAGGAAFALEAPAFVAAARGVHRALGQAEAPAPLNRDLAGAYLMLGGLKLFAGGARQALRLTGDIGLSRRLLPQLSAYLGVLAGHGLEHAAGLSQISSGDTLLLDSLATLLQFQAGGELAGRALGSRWRNFQRERIFSAEYARPSSPSAERNPKGLAWAMSGIGGNTPKRTFRSPEIYAMRDRESHFRAPMTVAPVGESPSLKIRWVPEGLPRLRIESERRPVNALIQTLESHLKKLQPHSLEIHYQGRMIDPRDQDQLKERLRPLIEASSVPEGFLTAIAFLQGMPKIALIFSKENGQMKFKFTQLRLPETSSGLSSIAPAGVSQAIRSIKRIEDMETLLPELDLNRSSHILFESPSWSIRDALRVERLLEKSPDFLMGHNLTLVMKHKSIQIRFAWESENGRKRVVGKTLPLDHSALDQPLSTRDRISETRIFERKIPETESSEAHNLGIEASNTAREPELSLPPSGELSESIRCQDATDALGIFSRLLSEQKGSSFQTPLIEIRRGKLGEVDLGILAEILLETPLPEGRKISFLWHERPSGQLKVHNEAGRITLEIREFGRPIRNYLLKPDFATQMKRFVRTESR